MLGGAGKRVTSGGTEHPAAVSRATGYSVRGYRMAKSVTSSPTTSVEFSFVDVPADENDMRYNSTIVVVS
jgi:hypothetical protein